MDNVLDVEEEEDVDWDGVVEWSFSV